MKAITVMRMQRGFWVLLAMVFVLAAFAAACTGGNDGDAAVAAQDTTDATADAAEAQAVDDRDAIAGDHDAVVHDHADEDEHAVAEEVHDEADDDHAVAATDEHDDADDDHAVAEIGHDEADEDHELAHEADEAGDVDRTITILAGEFTFGVDEIHVKVGETVRLVFQNEGAILHDITAPEFAGDVAAAGAAHEHETTMEGMDEMAFHAAAEAGEVGELVFTATQVGRYDLLCTVPGHAELGMTAVLVVEA